MMNNTPEIMIAKGLSCALLRCQNHWLATHSLKFDMFFHMFFSHAFFTRFFTLLLHLAHDKFIGFPQTFLQIHMVFTHTYDKFTEFHMFALHVVSHVLPHVLSHVLCPTFCLMICHTYCRTCCQAVPEQYAGGKHQGLWKTRVEIHFFHSGATVRWAVTVPAVSLLLQRLSHLDGILRPLSCAFAPCFVLRTFTALGTLARSLPSTTFRVAFRSLLWASLPSGGRIWTESFLGS